MLRAFAVLDASCLAVRLPNCSCRHVLAERLGVMYCVGERCSTPLCCKDRFLQHANVQCCLIFCNESDMTPSAEVMSIMSA